MESGGSDEIDTATFSVEKKRMLLFKRGFVSAGNLSIMLTDTCTNNNKHFSGRTLTGRKD